MSDDFRDHLIANGWKGDNIIPHDEFGALMRRKLQGKDEPMEDELQIMTIDIMLDSLVLDPVMQPRIGIDDEVVEEYAQAMRDGDQFPPLQVYEVDDECFVVDGWHRVYAADRAGLTDLPARVTVATDKRDAILASAGANTRHGLNRTNDDKRKAIRTVLLDEEARQWSDREIARWCKVHHETVANVRSEMEASGEIARSTDRKYVRDGQEITVDTANIGQNQRLKLAEDVGPYRVMTSGPLTRYGTEEDASDFPYKGIWKKHTDADGWREVEKFWFIGRDAAKTWHEEKVALLQRLIEEGKLPNESSFDTHREKNVATIDLYGDPALSEAVNQSRISADTAAYLIENHSPHIAAVVAGNMLPIEARQEVIEAQRRAVPSTEPAPTGHVDDAKRPGVSSALTEEEPEEDKSEEPQIVPLSFPDGLADKPWQTRYLTLSAQMDEDDHAVLLARAGLYWVALGIQAVRLEGVLAANEAGETFKHSFVDGPEDTKVAIVLPERGDRWQYDLMMTYDLHWYPETDEVAAFCELMTGGAPEAPVLTVVEPSAPDLSGPVERYLATVIEMYAQLDVLAAECLEECATDAEQAQITFHQDGRSLQSIRTMLEDHLYALDRMSARLADEAVVPKDNRRVHNLMQEIGGFLWTVHKERQANAERDSEAAR